jgi:hypothetical protein
MSTSQVLKGSLSICRNANKALWASKLFSSSLLNEPPVIWTKIAAAETNDRLLPNWCVLVRLTKCMQSDHPVTSAGRFLGERTIYETGFYLSKDARHNWSC